MSCTAGFLLPPFTAKLHGTRWSRWDNKVLVTIVMEINELPACAVCSDDSHVDIDIDGDPDSILLPGPDSLHFAIEGACPGRASSPQVSKPHAHTESLRPHIWATLESFIGGTGGVIIDNG